MAIGVYFNFEGGTVDQYDEVCRRLRPGLGLQSGPPDRIQPLGEGQGILSGARLEKAIEV